MATLHLPQLHRPRLRSLLWGVCGAAVLLYIFVFAIAGIDPWEAEVATIAAVVLAVAWTAHAWHRLWSDERRSS